MWQWMSQEPGLSALKAMATKPLAGSNTTSRRGGLSNLRFRFVGPGEIEGLVRLLKDGKVVAVEVDLEGLY